MGRGSHNPYSNGQINLAWSRSVHGPWKSRVILPHNADGDEKEWNCANNNPTVALKSDGSVFMIYRANPCASIVGGSEALGIAEASHWNATYVRRKGSPIVSAANGTGNHEDP